MAAPPPRQHTTSAPPPKVMMMSSDGICLVTTRPRTLSAHKDCFSTDNGRRPRTADRERAVLCPLEAYEHCPAPTASPFSSCHSRCSLRQARLRYWVALPAAAVPPVPLRTVASPWCEQAGGACGSHWISSYIGSAPSGGSTAGSLPHMYVKKRLLSLSIRFRSCAWSVMNLKHCGLLEIVSKCGERERGSRRCGACAPLDRW